MSDATVTATAPTDGEPPSGEPVVDRRWRVVALVMAPVVAFSALLGFGLGRDPRELPSAIVGRPAPTFELRDIETGDLIALSELRGHVVVVNFWATWCPPCRAEHPNLVEAWSQFGDRGVVFLSVLYQDTEANARAWHGQFPQGWPDLVDPGGRTALDFGVTGPPETYFVAADGTVAHRTIGPSSFLDLQEHIERLLPGPGADE
jgi:cytochrome c biogenesis protein CcmG, thiol:disulfide interchange protein DsbE